MAAVEVKIEAAPLVVVFGLFKFMPANTEPELAKIVLMEIVVAAPVLSIALAKLIVTGEDGDEPAAPLYDKLL